MDQITLKNFRCFQQTQTARLAPLTLLVGENSTGKTSFMAMIRILCDAAHYGLRIPDFKEEPYDLGSFDEIAHHRGTRGGRAATFKAGFTYSKKYKSRFQDVLSDEPFKFEIVFGRQDTVPVPVRRYIAWSKTQIEETFKQGKLSRVGVGTSRGKWERQVSIDKAPSFDPNHPAVLPFFGSLSGVRESVDLKTSEVEFVPISGSPALTIEDCKELERLAFALHGLLGPEWRPFASAPVRSKPRRTYDPSRPTPDPEGNNVPMYLANIYFHDKGSWEKLKDALEEFGQASGLFNEISIKPLGKKDSEPFQVQVRKSGGKLKGPRRNLIDVGYGVSQVLPVIADLLRHRAPPIFLLQQPEVHLHPSAQAALGTLFCQVAHPNRQLIVETHSDHLLSRVRMDVRDGEGNLKPEDVSILFFERRDLDVHIHSLEIDDEGNVLNAPPVYRQFFIDEMERSIWKRRKSKGN